MDRLPAELLEGIAGYTERDGEDSTRWRERGLFALRLTCRALYEKTFRTFGEKYISEVSVAFNYASLGRLEALATYKNIFGLSFAHFPTTIAISEYRVLSGDQLDRLLTRTSPGQVSLTAEAAGGAIITACKLGINNVLAGPYHSLVLARVERYKRAIREQREINNELLDISSLAGALASFTRLGALKVFRGELAWGQPDWERTISVLNKCFTENHDAQSGRTGLTIVASKALQAMAQAGSLIRANGTPLRLHRFDLLQKFNANGYPGPVKALQLHRLRLPAGESFKRSLICALSDVKVMALSLNPFAKHLHGPPEWPIVHELLRILLSSRSIESLTIEFDDNSGKRRFIISPSHMLALSELPPLPRLRSFTFSSKCGLCRVEDMAHFFQKHAATLEDISVETCFWGEFEHFLPGFEEAARCKALTKFRFTVVLAMLPGIEQMEAVEIINAEGSERVTEELNRVIKHIGALEE